MSITFETSVAAALVATGYPADGYMVEGKANDTYRGKYDGTHLG